MAFLELHNIVYQYGAQRALDGVSFSVEAGECFGLLGPNGAGKSTLLSILSCYRDAQSGWVQLQSEKISSHNQACRQSIGLAPQEIAVYGALTARENLLFFGRLYGVAKTELHERVDNLLEAVGLQSKAHHRVETFSGGMKRRMNLAAALVHKPPLLLLDEPTAGVDPQSRHHLFEEIRRVNRQGTTIIYTTHYMEEVEALCSRVAILDHGKLIVVDTLPSLINLIPSRVSLTLERLSPEFVQHLSKIEGMSVLELEGNTVQLEMKDSSSLLVKTVESIRQFSLNVIHMEPQIPTLERVFLHLTGRALRD
ncbi:MAG: ABC transporter ATP-binding protein [Planctomycetia bacterium]|nr:ABC transporter ATP-binding protein [Planctomycetia bacterium]